MKVNVESGESRNECLRKAMIERTPRSALSRQDTEVTAKAKRRRFSAEYKLHILEDVTACGNGEIGELLRREGLYSSHLTTWRRQQEAGQLAGWLPNQPGSLLEATLANFSAPVRASLTRSLWAGPVFSRFSVVKERLLEVES